MGQEKHFLKKGRRKKRGEEKRKGKEKWHGGSWSLSIFPRSTHLPFPPLPSSCAHFSLFLKTIHPKHYLLFPALEVVIHGFFFFFLNKKLESPFGVLAAPPLVPSHLVSTPPPILYIAKSDPGPSILLSSSKSQKSIKKEWKLEWASALQVCTCCSFLMLLDDSFPLPRSLTLSSLFLTRCLVPLYLSLPPLARRQR